MTFIAKQTIKDVDDATRTLKITERQEARTVSPDNTGLLQQILTTLQKIEYHLSIATDVNLTDQDVGG